MQKRDIWSPYTWSSERKRRENYECNEKRFFFFEKQPSWPFLKREFWIVNYVFFLPPTTPKKLMNNLFKKAPWKTFCEKKDPRNSFFTFSLKVNPSLRVEYRISCEWVNIIIIIRSFNKSFCHEISLYCMLAHSDIAILPLLFVILHMRCL